MPRVVKPGVVTAASPRISPCQVKSTFYSADEQIVADGVQRTDKDGKKITHRLEGGALVTDSARTPVLPCTAFGAVAVLTQTSSRAPAVVGTIVNWTETTTVDAADRNKMTTRISWTNADGSNGKSAQHFERNDEAEN